MKSYRVFSLLALAALILTGCDNTTSPDQLIGEANQTNLQRLSNLYSMYQMKHDFVGPADEAAFKSWLGEVDSGVLDPMGVSASNIDAIFTSERDGQPFKIRWSIQGSSRGCKEAAIFEQQGVEGKFMVGFLNMVQKEVDQAEYDQLMSGGGGSSPAQTGNDGRGDGRSGR